jgi:hypothetical protein
MPKPTEQTARSVPPPLTPAPADTYGRDFELVPSRPTNIEITGHVVEEKAGRWVAELLLVNLGEAVAEGRLMVVAAVRTADGSVVRLAGKERTFKAENRTTKTMELEDAGGAEGRVVDIEVVVTDRRGSVVYAVQRATGIAH